MPTLDRDAVRKGAEAIETAVESRGSGDGNFRPFLSNIYWKDDGQERYVLFLNPMEDIPQFEMHPYIDTGEGVPNMMISHTDPALVGSSVDPLQEQFGYRPRLSNLAIAVELEPEIKQVGKYKKPTGFAVKVREYERRVRDDEGNLTDEEEYEEVVSPIIGLVCQSPYNFFNQLRITDSTVAPLNQTALKITRLGKKDVTYKIDDFDGLPIDRTNLLEYIENVSYVEEPKELLAAIDGLDEVEASTVIGEYLLSKRIDELADEDTYNDILSRAEPAKFGDNKKKSKSDSKAKATRKARPSQRRASSEVSEESAPAESVTKGSGLEERLSHLNKRVQKRESSK